MKKINLFLLLFVFCTNFLVAQSYLSLIDALQLAEKNYPHLKAENWNITAAQEHLASVKAEVLMPALKLHEQVDYATANSVQGTYFSYGLSTSGGITAANNYDPVYGSVSLASLEWVPYSFGQNKSRMELSRIELTNSVLHAENEKFQLQIRVADVYLALTALHQLSGVAQTNFQRMKAIRAATAALARTGLRPGVDSSLANSELSRAILDLDEAQEKEIRMKLALANLVGKEKADFAIDSVTFFSKEPSIQNDTGFAALPLARLLLSQVDLSRSREKLITRSYFPKIYLLGAVWGRGSGMGIPAGSVSDRSFSGAGLARYNYALGVAATFNILDYPRVRSQFLSQKAITSSFAEEYNQLALDARTNSSAADSQIEFARKQKRETPIQLDAATNAFNQSKARYESGLATITEMQQSLYLLNRAAADKVIANNNLWRAFLQKAASTGNFSDFLNQVK